jgi:two-component system, NarL family, sensor histidine kinase EvgS
MDCEMPVLDGYLAAKMIREHERDNGFERCHMVGVSGNSGELFEKKCVKSGMEMMITKPVNINQLKKICQEVYHK